MGDQRWCGLWAEWAEVPGLQQCEGTTLSSAPLFCPALIDSINPNKPLKIWISLFAAALRHARKSVNVSGESMFAPSSKPNLLYSYITRYRNNSLNIEKY